MKIVTITVGLFCVLGFASCGIVEVEDGADGEGPYPIWCERTQTETTDGVTKKSTWVSEFDEQGRLSAFKYTTIEIDQYGEEDVSSCTDWWVAYDENGRTIEWRRRGCNNTGSGSSWQMEYDDRGYLSLIQYREGGENPYEFDSSLTWEDGKLVRMDDDDFDEQTEDLYMDIVYGSEGRMESSVLTDYYQDGTIHQTTRSFSYGEDEWRPETTKAVSIQGTSIKEYTYLDEGLLANYFTQQTQLKVIFEYNDFGNILLNKTLGGLNDESNKPLEFTYNYSCW